MTIESTTHDFDIHEDDVAITGDYSDNLDDDAKNRMRCDCVDFTPEQELAAIEAAKEIINGFQRDILRSFEMLSHAVITEVASLNESLRYMLAESSALKAKRGPYKKKAANAKKKAPTAKQKTAKSKSQKKRVIVQKKARKKK